MATDKIIQEATDLVFCQRVALLAIRMASDVSGESPDTPNHEARLAYANQVFRGDDKAMLLVMHIIAANDAIAEALDNGTAADVQDTHIQEALRDIWDPRSTSFAVTDIQFNKAQTIVEEAFKVQQESKNIAETLQSVQQDLHRMAKEAKGAK